MPESVYRNRRAVAIENDRLRVTVLIEGGHIAEIFHKQSGVNPLWTPPWPSIEPSTYSPNRHPEYGADSESKLLAGLMGHNLCLDLFGAPSDEEAAAGMNVHGEASIVEYQIDAKDGELTARATMPMAQLAIERVIRLRGTSVHFTETVENLSALDRPSAWTQHVTLGPPFLVGGSTELLTPATQSRTLEGVDFDWPMRPHDDGRVEDLQIFTSAPVSGGFTTHLMDPHLAKGFFIAWSPESKVLFGYEWAWADFPWLGLWEENRSRQNPPWNGRTITRGLEFGASPMPESRRKMIERNTLFGVPAYRWLPAKSKVTVEYRAFIQTAESLPSGVPTQ